MAYLITVESPTEIILTPEMGKAGCGRWGLGGLGLLLLGVGGGLLWLRFGSGADAINLGAGLFTAFGLGALLLALQLRATAGWGPAAFVFDRARAGVWLRGQATDNAARAAAARAAPVADGFLPFAAIAELLVTTRTYTGSTTWAGSGRTTYTHHVVLHLHDGSAWTLTSAPERAEAEAVLARLHALVAAAAPAPPAPPAPVLPATLAVRRSGGTTQVRWRNSVRLAQVLRGLAFMAFVGGALAVFVMLSHSQGKVPLFVDVLEACIGLGYVLGGVAQFWQWWRDAHRRYGLDLGPDAVAYVEEASATGHETLRHAVPLAEWYGLNTSYDAADSANSEYEPVVLFLTRAAHAQQLHKRVAAAFTANLARPLRVAQSGPTQRLVLVQWAQAEAARQQAER